MDEVHRLAYGEDDVFAINLCLEEALINAIKHGNQLDPKKMVTIEAAITSEKAEIMIEDQGPGFVKSDVPDPTSDENLDKPSGRGILLIEAYMTSAQWSNKGRRIKMTRRNTAAATRPA